MATETIIPESLCLKTGEREDNAFSSEILEENITQLLDNKVKQLESGPNQPLETSSQVIETVNTQLETGIPTNESGTFFQALSIPKVAADEHINTPESCVTTTTEDQEVRTMTGIEATTEGKPNEEQVVAVALKEAFANEQQPNKGDHELVEAIPAQTQGSVVQVVGKELEQVTDVSYKDESMGGSLNTAMEAVNDEGKVPEFVKTKESIKEDTEDATPGVATEDQGLHEDATNDVCVSTEIKHEEETIKNEEKKDEMKEGGEESSPEKAESELSDSIVPSKKEALNTLEKAQGDSESVTSSQNATCEDIKETITGQHATTVAEQDHYERPRELIKEQIEDKSINAQEANELCEDEVKGEGEPKPEGSVKKTEEEGEIDKIRPSVEIEEKVDQDGLLHAITTDACISTQTKSQVDIIEHDKKDEEEATQSDDSQKEKSDSPPIKQVFEDNSSEKVEHEKEQEVNVLDKDQDEIGITSTQDVAFEGGLREKNHHSEGNTVSTGVCISTQTEPHEETIENEEKNDEDVIESDDGNTKSSGSPMIKEICEETVPEKAESDEVLKSSDSFSMVLNENEIVSKDEDQEKEQVLYVSQKHQTESQVNTTKLEEGHEEEVIESNDSQNENSDSLSIKEVCEETESEKVESERAELSDSSSIKLNEKAVAILNEDEVQEKEQGQVEDDVTCSQDATSIEELQGKHREDIGKEPESDIIRESLELDSEEMKSSVETSSEIEYQGLLHDGITTDVCVSTQTELEKVSSKNEEKTIDMDVCEETSPKNAESEGRLELSDNVPPSKKEALSTLEKDQGDSEGVKNSQDASIGTDLEEQDQNEKPREFLKEDTKDKSADAQKANEQCENGENDKIEEYLEESVIHNDQEKEQDVHKLEEDQGEDDVASAQDLQIEGGLQEKNFQSEANNHEAVNAKKSIEEETEEIRYTVETPDSSEQQTLINTNATEVCISTQTEPEEETAENEKKNDEEAIGSEDGSPVIKKLNEETVSEKAESKDALKPSENPEIVLNDNETVNKDEDQEKEQDLYVSERGQCGGDDVTSLENASNKDIKETTIGEHVTTVAYFEEGQTLSAMPKEIIKEETEDKSIDAQEATKKCDDGTKDDVEQKEESANEIEHSSSKIEQAEYTEEIKPSVETNEEKDVCISAKIESQEQATKNEEKAIEIDVAQKEKSDNLLDKKVCEEIDLTMSESTEDINLSHSSNVEISEKTITSLKDEDREKDQEVSISTEDQGKDNDTSSQHVVSKEEGLQEQRGGFVKTRESIDEDTEENKSSDETKENVITTDVCSTTKTEPIEATTGSEEKNEEEATENDDRSQTTKPESPLFKEVCEATSSEKADFEVQDGGDEVISSHNASNEEIKETSGQHATTVAYFEEGLGVSALTKEILKEEAENKPIDAQEEVKQCENEATDKREEKPEESVNEPVNSLTIEGGINEDEVDAGNKEIEAKLDAESQTHRTEDISEMKDEVVSKEKMSLELGQPKEQNVEEIQAYLVDTVSENSEDEIKKEDGDLSHESVGNTNDNTAKEENYTLKHELVEEQHSGVDEVLKEKNINLNDTTIEPQEDIMPSSSSGVPTEETSNLEKEKEESGILPIEDLKTVSEVVTKSEDSKLKEECLITETATYMDEEKGALRKEISSDEKAEQTKEIKQETVKEECEGISSEKAEFEEGLELSDSSNMQINEKLITSFKDDDQEKEHEVNLSGEGQDKDDVLSSQNKVSEEEDTKEIKPSVGTNENTEQKELLHVVTTDDCSSTHTEHEETKEKEEENDEEAIENDEVEDKSIDTLEAFGKHENEAKDKREQKPEEHANSCSETVEGNIQKDEADAGNTTEIEAKLNAENQADIGEDGSEMKDEAVSIEKMSTELGQPKAPSVEEIQACLTENKSEKTEDDITENDEDKSHDNSIKEEKCFQDGITREIEISTLEHEPVEEQTGDPDEVSKENFTNSNEATVEAQEDIKLSSSLGTSTEDVEFVSEIQNPEVVPMSEDSKSKEECLISATTTYVDEEKETATEEIPSVENLEPYGSTQKSENLKSTREENVTQLEKTGEINSVYEKRKMEEDVTQENQINSEENCSEMVKDVILTEEVPLEIEKENGINDYEEQVVEEDNYSTELQKISAQNQKEMAPEMSYSDPIPAGNPDATEVKVEDKEDISCESKVKKDGVDEEPKEERIISPEDSATIKPQVDLSNIDSTPHLSESEKLATQVLESVGDVQTPEAVADSAETKMKEECGVLAKEEHIDESNVEEEPKIKTYETVIASDTEQENVKQEFKSDDLNIEEKALTKEDLELHGELKLTSELMLEEDQAIETEPQPEQSDITSENKTSDQTLESKLEHTSEKPLEDEKRDTEENVTITPESQIKSIDNQIETTKNVILTDDVVVETLNESGKNEVIGQISEEDNCPTELNNTSAPDQKELANKIEYSKLISAGNTETTEVKAENQIELENIQAAEDLAYLSKAFSAENKKEAPILEFEKKEGEELISEVQIPESILKMETKQEHPETTNDICETLISGESSEKKLVSMAPPEEVTSLTAEDKTNELVLETDNTKAEQSSISNRDWNPEFLEENSSEGQKGIIEKYIEEAGQGNFGVESKEVKSGNEVVEDVNANEVLLEVEKATESKSIKENINEEASCIHNQSPLATDEACQIERLNSSPNEVLETKDVVKGKTDMILMAEILNVKDEAVTVIKEPNEDMKHNFENMMTDEEITKTDGTEEKQTLEEPQTDDPVKTLSDSISSYTDQDVQVGSDDRKGHRDMHKLEENSTEDFEITSEETEIVPEGKEASTKLIDDLPEASPKILLAEQDQEIATTAEKIEEKINDKDETVVNMNSSTSTKDVACLSSKKNGEIQVSSLNSEIDEGKKNGSGDMMNIEKEAVQPQEHISKIKFVDPASDAEIREQEVMHYGSQEPSEDNTLLSHDDKKTEDPVILQSVEKDIIQGVDKRLDEADVQKHEKDFDYEGTSTEAAIPIESVKTPDVELKPVIDAIADKAEKEVLKEDMHFKSTCDGSKTTEEVSGMKQEKLKLDSPVSYGTVVKEDLEISQKNATDDLIIISHVQPAIQKYEVSDCTVDEQSPNKPHQNESTESKLLAGIIDASHEQGETTAKSLIAEAEDLNSAKASSTEPQCSSELLKEDKKTNDEKERFETTEPAQISFADVTHEPTKGNSEVTENLIGERETAVAKDQQVDKKEIGDSEVKTDEENEDDEEDNEDNQKMGSCSDAPVMVEASKDMEPKVHKKSHNILSGVGSKVKHSIAKVKKAITGKSSNSKPPSPKEKDQEFA